MLVVEFKRWDGQKIIATNRLIRDHTPRLEHLLLASPNPLSTSCGALIDLTGLNSLKMLAIDANLVTSGDMTEKPYLPPNLKHLQLQSENDGDFPIQNIQASVLHTAKSEMGTQLPILRKIAVWTDSLTVMVGDVAQVKRDANKVLFKKEGLELSFVVAKSFETHQSERYSLEIGQNDV